MLRLRKMEMSLESALRKGVTTWKNPKLRTNDVPHLLHLGGWQVNGHSMSQWKIEENEYNCSFNNSHAKASKSFAGMLC